MERDGISYKRMNVLVYKFSELFEDKVINIRRTELKLCHENEHTLANTCELFHTVF